LQLSAEGKKKFAPRLLAMDCEMCETSKGTRELLGVSVCPPPASTPVQGLPHAKALLCSVTGPQPVFKLQPRNVSCGPTQVVDAHGNALLKTLVKPRGDIIDLRTNITGITSEQLATVTTTCHDVRRQVHTAFGKKSNMRSSSHSSSSLKRHH
jgi:hypothetical protein